MIDTLLEITIRRAPSRAPREDPSNLWPYSPPWRGYSFFVWNYSNFFYTFHPPYNKYNVQWKNQLRQKLQITLSPRKPIQCVQRCKPTSHASEWARTKRANAVWQDESRSGGSLAHLFGGTCAHHTYSYRTWGKCYPYTTLGYFLVSGKRTSNKTFNASNMFSNMQIMVWMPSTFF